MAKEAVVRVGPAGWSYEDWKGIVYPPGMPSKLHPLEFLSRYFDTVEVNTSYYRPIKPQFGPSWLGKVADNPRFKFTLKLWKRFTHERDTWPSEEDIAVVRRGLDPFAEADKLGAVLVQFPWSFKRTVENRTWLGRVLDAFADYPLALEIRHASWNCPPVYGELARRKVAFCNIDQPLFANSLAPTDKVTARVGYVRLHGRNATDWFREDAGRDNRYDYLYSLGELKGWLEKIERIRAMADEVYAITNNHYRGQAVVNAFELQDGLGHPSPEPPPQSLIDEYPRLKDVTTPPQG